MKIRDMISMLYPPYFPNLVLSNFYLFTTVKERLEDAGIMNGDELFEELRTTLMAIPNEELESVFKA
jgi:hypothetical protein